jgi:ABC-type cobalamin/Fe3+-siderophores transport system ATPase subunit
VDISIPGLELPIKGSSPIVILGANGSGKTRLAVEMTRSVGAEFIPALRNIALPDQIPNWTLQTATNELNSRTNQRQNSYWELIQDIDALFGKLWSSHAVEAMRVYDQLLEGKAPGKLTDTVLNRTKELWRQVFPGRSISFSDFSAKITNEYLGSSTYTAKHMSDGERTGLYLAARILDTDKGIVVIDEPETHFHSRLAVRFWDALESLCPDTRFVYVTHDLTFALSRRDASVVLARPNTSPELIQPGTALPSEDVASILGAASFSVYAKRLVFCEGKEEKSLDQELLRAWFNDKSTALIPVGGCENVKRCTAAFGVSSVVSGFDAVGIIDRDHWPDDLLKGFKNIHVLPVHEIESLFVLKPVYVAIAIHSGHSQEAVEQMYESLFESFRQQMKGVLANKLIGERFKAKTMMFVERAFSRGVDGHDRAQLMASVIGQITSVRAVADPESIWREEESTVEAALAATNPDEFLRVLPGKPLLGPAASSIGITKERYCELVKTALSSSEPAFAILKQSLEKALSPYLPPRVVQG